jgi:molybdate transport system regulatory protein
MLVDVMNRCFTQPLVLTAKGGQHGGGTILTPFGRQVVDNYLQITTALNHTMTAYLPLFSGLVREQCLMDGKDATNPISE